MTADISVKLRICAAGYSCYVNNGAVNEFQVVNELIFLIFANDISLVKDMLTIVKI